LVKNSGSQTSTVPMVGRLKEQTTYFIDDEDEENNIDSYNLRLGTT